MKFTSILLASTVFAGMAGAVAADDHDKMHPADANKDGILERAEVLAPFENKFAELDSNGDGYLTLAELPERVKMAELAPRAPRAPRPPRPPRFDGKDFDEIWPEMEARMRENGMSDEDIAKRKARMEERVARMKEREAEMGEREVKMRERMEKRSEEREAMMKKRMEEGQSRMAFIGRFDEDGDERVSLEEFTSRPARRFDRADANNDGRVTEDERPGRRSEHRGKRKEKS